MFLRKGRKKRPDPSRRNTRVKGKNVSSPKAFSERAPRQGGKKGEEPESLLHYRKTNSSGNSSAEKERLRDERGKHLEIRGRKKESRSSYIFNYKQEREFFTDGHLKKLIDVGKI